MTTAVLERVQQNGTCPRICSEDIVDEELIGVDWEVALSSESNEEPLPTINCRSDDNDEELAQLRQNQREFREKYLQHLRNCVNLNQ